MNFFSIHFIDNNQTKFVYCLYFINNQLSTLFNLLTVINLNQNLFSHWLMNEQIKRKVKFKFHLKIKATKMSLDYWINSWLCFSIQRLFWLFQYLNWSEIISQLLMEWKWVNNKHTFNQNCWDEIWTKLN